MHLFIYSDTLRQDVHQNFCWTNIIVSSCRSRNRYYGIFYIILEIQPVRCIKCMDKPVEELFRYGFYLRPEICFIPEKITHVLFYNARLFLFQTSFQILIEEV